MFSANKNSPRFVLCAFLLSIILSVGLILHAGTRKAPAQPTAASSVPVRATNESVVAEPAPAATVPVEDAAPSAPTELTFEKYRGRVISKSGMVSEGKFVSYLTATEARVRFAKNCVDASEVNGGDDYASLRDFDGKEFKGALVNILGSESRATDVIVALKAQSAEESRGMMLVCKVGASVFVVLDDNRVTLLGGPTYPYKDTARPSLMPLGYVKSAAGLTIRGGLLPSGQPLVTMKMGDGGTFVWQYYAIDEKVGVLDLIEDCRIEVAGESETSGPQQRYECTRLFEPLPANAKP